VHHLEQKKPQMKEVEAVTRGAAVKLTLFSAAMRPPLFIYGRPAIGLSNR
jgi:hypothetical protein